ncbi:hypothetical protein NPS29_00915 [Pseudomonas putida]|uniref:hypothetical protein n=1 Tax=Pseudomonas putida TaxID=303 RepID=UPI00236379A7|nr:hypothetical protein [Pseudomonas putida]MDD1963870.1 hypothetical protein [Pseudomonas putida]
MNSSTIPGENRDDGDVIQPLEPGRPDVMPNPPPGGDEGDLKEDGVSPPSDDDVKLDEDMSDVEANDSVSEEHPPLR